MRMCLARAARVRPRCDRRGADDPRARRQCRAAGPRRVHRRPVCAPHRLGWRAGITKRALLLTWDCFCARRRDRGTCAVLTAGSIYCWGQTGTAGGHLTGDGATVASYTRPTTPVSLPAGKAIQVCCCCPCSAFLHDQSDAVLRGHAPCLPLHYMLRPSFLCGAPGGAGHAARVRAGSGPGNPRDGPGLLLGHQQQGYDSASGQHGHA
jgi:hypothetical protein